jgi:hypothetical protein
LDALVQALENDTELPDAPPPLTPGAELLLANGLKTLDNPQFAAYLARGPCVSAPLTAPAVGSRSSARRFACRRRTASRSDSCAPFGQSVSTGY